MGFSLLRLILVNFAFGLKFFPMTYHLASSMSGFLVANQTYLKLINEVIVSCFHDFDSFYFQKCSVIFRVFSEFFVVL